jgi:hypothetical protein
LFYFGHGYVDIFIRHLREDVGHRNFEIKAEVGYGDKKN